MARINFLKKSLFDFENEKLKLAKIIRLKDFVSDNKIRVLLNYLSSKGQENEWEKRIYDYYKKKELKNSKKDTKIVDKIALGKLNKFINENTLLNQEWIMDPQKKVKDIIKETAKSDKIIIKRFIRYKVGEGI